MAAQYCFCTLVITVFLVGPCVGETCYYSYTYDYNLYYDSSIYCYYGCCGYYSSRTCCTNVGGIVGIVLGSLFSIALVVGIIVGIVCACRKSGQPGTVMQPGQQHAVTTVTSTTQATGQQHAPYPPQPYHVNPGYSQPVGHQHPM